MSGMRWTNDALNQISVILKAVRGRSGFDTNGNGELDNLRGYMTRYSQRLKMLADAQAGTEKQRAVPTEFVMNAKELDQGRGQDYWTQPHELAARAFQGYIEDKIAEQGGKSPFLNYAPEGAGILTPWGVKRPFPTGAERKAINSAFDNLVSTIQTKETGKGVALFSRSTHSVTLPLSQRAGLQAVAEEAEQRLAQFVHQPPVVIRESAVGVIPGVRAGDGNAVAGATHGGKIYLFLDQIASRAEARSTLFHELLHYGLRRFLTKEQFTEKLLNLYQRDAYLRREADAWVKTADGERAQAFGGADYALARGVDEALATLAEPNQGRYLQTAIGASLVRRVTNWLAGLAEWAGFKSVAAELRAIKNQEAREFIQSVFQRLKEDAPATSGDWAFTADDAFSSSSTIAKSFNVDGLLSAMGRSAAITRAGSTTSRAVMEMAREGQSSQNILRLVAGTSKSRFNRQVARLLLRTGAAPSVKFEDADLGGGDGFKFLAKYSRKADAVTLTPGAELQAESIFMHEMIHAATLRALDRKGLASLQMRRLYEHVKKQGGAAGQYGMKNVGEFVAEAFTNPAFQQDLRSMSAPAGGTLKSAWHSFVRILRSILGLPQDGHDALSRALELGVAVMREDMALRQRGAERRQAGDAFVQSPQTRATFEGRIDALFSGGKATTGTRVLDRSDVMGLLGHPDVPLMLNERHLLDGLTNHPEMTASAWKKVPGWLENPAAVYTDPRHPGRYTVIAPERIAGYPVVLAVEPNAGNPARGKGGATPAEQLLVTVFANTTGDLPALGYLAASGRLLYADTKTAPVAWPRAGEIPRAGGKASGAKRILTEKHLNGWRKANLHADGKGADGDDAHFGASAAGTQTSAWEAPAPTGFDDLIYKLQDKNIDLKRVIEAITKAVGQVSDSVNAYLKEELFHKRAAKRVEDFGARELKPLLNQMRIAGLSMEDVEEYLHARHAKEANAVIAERNPDNPGLQDGGSGMTNQAADNYFANLDPAQRRKLEAVAAKVDAIIAETRKLYVSYGLEDQAVVDGWASMYQHYIPLQREDKEGGMGIGQGFSVKGKETKGRTGSTRKVVDILANIASQREKLIVRGEKNRVTQALVGLAQANPNPDFWEVRSQAPTERVFDPKTGVVVDRPDPLFRSRDNVVVAKVKDSKGNVTEQMVVFNEDNPRAVRMATALKNLDMGNLEGLLGVSAKITRYFSAINTQYNPVFGVVNLVRDVQGAMVNLAATPLAGKQAKIARDTLSALRGIYGDIRKTRMGGQATSQWAQLWEQMQDDGGTTGYRELFKTSADRGADLKSILNPEGWMDSKLGRFFTADGRLKVPVGMAKKGAGFIFDWLSDYNEAMENGVRLAAYKAALDKGMSREQAASLAKNLTVNFNRKGQVGQQAGAVYAFFNAAMQGTARIGQTLFDMDGGDVKTLRLSKTGKAVVYGGVMLGVMQALALAGAGFDEEDPPEFVRERSLIIPTGGKTYIAIPMPLGLHVIPGIGRHATEFALSGFDKPAQRAVSVVGMFADAFNPIGNAGLSMQTLAPTALDPLVALTENKDWTGKPIARTSFNKAMPGHTQWKDTATEFSKVVAEAINWVSGGNEYVSGAFSPTPDQIDYLLAQIGGGVAREASKVEQTVRTALSGEELPTYKVPLLGRFVGNAASQASQGTEFYSNLNKLNELETEVKGLRKDGKYDEAAKLMRENPQAILIPLANKAERDVQKLRREKRELIAKDAGREAVRAKEEQITAVMMRLNEAASRRKAVNE